MMDYESKTKSCIDEPRGVLQYYCPILFEGGMDIEECEMYYNQVAVQQNGGTSPSRNETCHIIPQDTILLSRNEIASILRKSRYEKPKETSTRPSFVRRFSFSNHKLNNETQSVFSSLRRSNSIQRNIAPRVKFHEDVHVVTIDSLDDIPFEIRHKLWMSRDEISFCMHEAAIVAKRLEDIIREKQKLLEEESEEADQAKEVMAERRHSNTSVTDNIDDDDHESLYHSVK